MDQARLVRSSYVGAVLSAMLIVGTAPRALHAQETTPAASGHASWVDPSPHRVEHVTVRPSVALEVLDWGGHGIPLVFLAGYGNTAHVFDDFAPRFRDRYRVFAITRRGFGASTLAPTGYDNATLADDVLAVLDTLRLQRPVLVAHSFGGAELNGIAIRRPGAVRAFIYLDAGFDFAELYADSEWAHVRIPRPPPPPDVDDSPRAGTAYAALMTGPGYPEAEVRAQEAWAARLQATPAFHAESLEVWIRRGTPRADLHAIRVPALAIYGVPRTVGEKYPWVSSAPTPLRLQAERRFAVEAPLLARQRVRFAREVPDARVVEVPGGRHYVYLTHPRQVAAAIRHFVR